ncbi:hypothetical protein FSARC_259 [Fusarium sarcochroum]|uniref:AMP-dependent synthetase/ligase domain-containing protein n=1 Tax=Fusarium sarcochroum TaxID=1208366 RepID=A0A8H4UC86_9HYPO|nr:hypothetical protein FSARC_259 [Fusarium sarcochroum]
MTLLQTPLTLLDGACTAHPSAIAIRSAFKDGTTLNHRDISYAALKNDIDATAAHWVQTLSQANIKAKSVIGLWVKGISYQDLLQIWGILRAGYVPQLFSLRLTDPSVIYELLIKGEASALICDSAFAPILQNCPVPTFHAQDISTFDNPRAPEIPQRADLDPNGVWMVYHTSGSTSGAPKLVSLTTRWLDCLIRKIQTLALRFTCLKGQFTNVLLLSMFPPFLSLVFREARRDLSLVQDLQHLNEIAYGGLPLDPSDVAWAQQQGLGLVDAFGSTEVGLVMVSESRDNLNLVPFPESNYEFIPLEGISDGDEDRLLELAVLPSSADCPSPAFRDDDGKFHTGDLFVEVIPGQYKFKGRNDDWIKMQTSLRCDTASIEAEAMRTCAADLITVVVVVGGGRPSPAMIVELKEDAVAHATTEIFGRMAPFFKRRYIHERIGDERLILVAPLGTLPRTATKGGIRRKEAEKMYSTVLDKLFAECA